MASLGGTSDRPRRTEPSRYDCRAADEFDDVRRRLRNRGVQVAVLAGLGVAALAATPPTPHETSTIAPEQVLRRYVQATLSAHDNTAAAAFVCHQPRLQAMRRWQDELADRVQRWHLPPMSADVTGYTDSGTAGRQVTAAADVVVTLTVDDRPQERLIRSGNFTLVDQDGWKVCAATLSD